ncbi:MAG: hypothetical protein IPP52_18765 [Ignavibacteria bacterium]|nr:hypothetical protein [Ignavibacteria bacterium]
MVKTNGNEKLDSELSGNKNKVAPVYPLVKTNGNENMIDVIRWLKPTAMKISIEKTYRKVTDSRN